MPHETKVSAALFGSIAHKAKEAEGNLDAVTRLLQPWFPTLSASTLRGYIRVARNTSPETQAAFLKGEISAGVITGLAGFSPEIQEILLREGPSASRHGLGLKRLRKIRRAMAEGMSLSEAVARASGKMPAQRPPSGADKTLPDILNEAAALGAKWRAKVATALEALRALEEEGGIYAPLFEKAMLVRQVVQEQYQFINSTVQRYLKVLKQATKGATR